MVAGSPSTGGGQGLIDQGYGVGQGGTILPQGGTFQGNYTLQGTILPASGGGFGVPYGTATPTLSTAGQMAVYFKGGTTFISTLGTGGTFYSMYMSTTAGTVLYLVGTALP